MLYELDALPNLVSIFLGTAATKAPRIAIRFNGTEAWFVFEQTQQESSSKSLSLCIPRVGLSNVDRSQLEALFEGSRFELIRSNSDSRWWAIVNVTGNASAENQAPILALRATRIFLQSVSADADARFRIRYED